MVHGLLRSECRCGRQNTKGISGQHHNIPGMVGYAFSQGVGDLAQRIGRPGVFREAGIIRR
jgi:hypothetical protein